jgi:hypothetical protein
MPAKNLEANVRHQSGVVIVDLHGELNAFAEERLFAVYAEALQYPTTDRGNEENQTSLPVSPDMGNASRTVPDVSNSHQGKPDDFAPGTGVVLLNFSDVDYINSVGIALIVNLLTQARKAHRRLLACGLSVHYVEIFQITRLADFIAIFPDEASALAAVSSFNP